MTDPVGALASGRHYAAIPGPSVMPDRVLAAMHRAAPDIYEGELHDLVDSLYPDLCAAAGTVSGRCAIYICNGHGVWEAALANVLRPGDEVLVAATGRFGHGWAQVAARLGAKVQMIDFGKSSPADPDRIADALRADREGRLRAVLLTHTDTSSSVRSDLQAIGAAIRATGHPALVMADCIASLGCDEYRMDDWGIDVTLSASQKGLMTPPGLGFLHLSERAQAVRKQMESVSPYWDWAPRIRPQEFYQHFCGTAPTHHLFALREALTMLVREEGLPAVWARHRALARAVWAAFEHWGEGGDLRMNVADPAHRSWAVTAAGMATPDATRLRRWTKDRVGVTLGIGLGMAHPGDPGGDGFFRMAHMGHVNAHMTLGVLGVIEAGLEALAIPHRPGGVAAAARVVAEAAGGDATGAKAGAPDQAVRPPVG